MVPPTQKPSALIVGAPLISRDEAGRLFPRPTEQVLRFALQILHAALQPVDHFARGCGLGGARALSH